VLHPQYFAEGGAWGGAIYGDVRSSWQAGPLHQPPHRLAHGLNGRVWQVGTSVHPGGGIPGVLGSALMVDEMISLSL
jgi:phytoene desaturase